MRRYKTSVKLSGFDEFDLMNEGFQSCHSLDRRRRGQEVTKMSGFFLVVN
jgi:hypothetical protein